MDSLVVRAAEVVVSYAVVIALFWAFFDATRFTTEQFLATKRMRRTPWLIVLGSAIALDFWLGGFRLDDPLGARSLAWLAGVMVLFIYLFDMRPRLLEQRMAGA